MNRNRSGLLIWKGRGIKLLLLALASSLYAQSPDAFSPQAEQGSVSGIFVQPDGKVLAGGLFGKLGGQTRKCLGRVNADGTLDTAFAPFVLGTNAPNTAVNGLAVQEDGKVIVGGRFTNLAGITAHNLGRLNADGTPDASFDVPALGIAAAQVFSFMIQPDYKILVSGRFRTLGGLPRTNIARLNIDGSLDGTFDAGGVGLYGSILFVQDDGKILVSGTLTNAGGVPVALGRLNTNGTWDNSFLAASNYISGGGLLVQPDGRILFLRTNFTQLVRLEADGALDPTFNVVADFYITSLALQTDGKIIVGGGFTNLNGQPRTGLARVDASGALDPSFSVTIAPFPSPSIPLPVAINTSAIQQDGKALIAGSLVSVNGQFRTNIARLDATSPATELLSFNATSVTWLRGGSSPEVYRTSFDYTTSGNYWTALGAGTRIASGWQLTNVVIPAGSVVRARGYPSGVQSRAMFFVENVSALKIVTDDGLFGFRTNGFGFDVIGSLGRTVVIDRATSLFGWTPVSTNLLTIGGLHFSDPVPASPAQFYRGRYQ